MILRLSANTELANETETTRLLKWQQHSWCRPVVIAPGKQRQEDHCKLGRSKNTASEIFTFVSFLCFHFLCSSP